MAFNLLSQNYVYGPDGQSKHFKSGDIEISFSDPQKLVNIPQKIGGEMAGAIISSLPTLVNMGFQLTTSILEKRVKKFSCEYTKSQSYLEAGGKKVPKITFIRSISFDDNNSYKPALEIVLVPYEVQGIQGFIYSVDSIILNYSSAKFRKEDSGLDYTIEIKPTFFINNEKKSIETSPIAISSVKFGENGNSYSNKKNRTDIIIMPNGAVLTEVSLKVIESNPAKVGAEKILSTWNSYKDSTKTIINNFLPKEKESQGAGTTETQGGGNTQTQSGGTTQTPNKK